MPWAGLSIMGRVMHPCPPAGAWGHPLVSGVGRVHMKDTN
ncbi:hypothetical protein GXY_12168 [Novacetimonas hansenii ATCC 23769]|uniref:Uncharacterized protein n=1 Tax=Novacetimonas hansenii ATCC 23769 TaxID=714995 RepID=D5QHG6_NOVHA|nr:hypothetical protein GXY_12168 [Novacetimonas hansenii ATCC 23769]